jgi:hypothetical protein
VLDEGARGINHLIAQQPESPTKVNVLEVHEEVRIEAAHIQKGSAVYQHGPA